MLETIFYTSLGLILFFIGLHLTEKGLIKGTGTRLERTLQFFTSNTLTGILTGIMVTALIQSSSAVSVMVIGCVGGGVMTISQAMGVIIGANIGTTMTIHILSLQMQYLEWILSLGGFVIMVYGWMMRREKIIHSGLVALGFGLIFWGLKSIQLGLTPLQYLPGIMEWLMELTTRPKMGILAGFGLTALIQSSSAVSGILLTIARQGMITLTGAIGVILGSNVGTCVTAMLAGIKSNSIARRVAYFHLIFNCFGVLISIPFLGIFSQWIALLTDELGRQIALAHTIFNIITTILILPFLNPLGRILSGKK